MPILIAPAIAAPTIRDKIKAKIAELNETIEIAKAEIRELEATDLVICRLEGGAVDRPFAGKKIRECLRILLQEKSPQGWRNLAAQAIARGYTSQKGGDTEIIYKSFQTTLQTFKDDFERIGPGVFGLKKEPPEVAKK